MIVVKHDPLVSRFGRPVSSRAVLAISHAIFESKIRPEIVPFGSSRVGNRALQSYFDTLLQQDGCKAAWEAYTIVTTGFPAQLANGTVPLNGFRHYNVQDAIYLEYYVRVRMAAIGTLASNVSTNDLLEFVSTINEGLDYSASVRSICENQLGIPTAAVDNEWNNGKSQQLKNSIEWYEKAISDAITNEDSSWIDIHFALLPCIKGYYEIAKALIQDPATLRNTLYYSLWIEANADGSYASEYDDFLQNNTEDATQSDWDRWGTLFKQSCNNELNFFNLAISGYPQYDIVSPGSYTIEPFAYKSEFLAGDSQGGVEISTTSTSWTLANSPDGYSIQLGDGQFLGYSDGKVVIQSTDATKWSINPVYIPGYDTYQLFLGTTIELALNVDSTKQVSVAKNDATTQTWILTVQA